MSKEYQPTLKNVATACRETKNRHRSNGKANKIEEADEIGREREEKMSYSSKDLDEILAEGERILGRVQQSDTSEARAKAEFEILRIKAGVAEIVNNTSFTVNLPDCKKAALEAAQAVEDVLRKYWIKEQSQND